MNDKTCTFHCPVSIESPFINGWHTHTHSRTARTVVYFRCRLHDAKCVTWPGLYSGFGAAFPAIIIIFQSYFDRIRMTQSVRETETRLHSSLRVSNDILITCAHIVDIGSAISGGNGMRGICGCESSTANHNNQFYVCLSIVCFFFLSSGFSIFISTWLG